LPHAAYLSVGQVHDATQLSAMKPSVRRNDGGFLMQRATDDYFYLLTSSTSAIGVAMEIGQRHVIAASLLSAPER